MDAPSLHRAFAANGFGQTPAQPAKVGELVQDNGFNALLLQSADWEFLDITMGALLCDAARQRDDRSSIIAPVLERMALIMPSDSHSASFKCIQQCILDGLEAALNEGHIANATILLAAVKTQQSQLEQFLTQIIKLSGTPEGGNSNLMLDKKAKLLFNSLIDKQARIHALAAAEFDGSEAVQETLSSIPEPV